MSYVLPRFNCSHDDLVKNWNQDGFQDYELTSTEGNCQYCLDANVTILTQIGAARFGVSAGFCLRCIEYVIPRKPMIEAKALFNESSDVHMISIDSEKIENFVRDRAESQGLSKENIDGLTKAVKENQSNPALLLSREYSKKKHQCKNCFGYILEVVSNGEGFDSFDILRKNRSKDNYMTCCFGCAALSARVKGCSILKCPTTQCATQICVFCLFGASEDKTLKHNLYECSQKVEEMKTPPMARLCECPPKQ